MRTVTLTSHFLNRPAQIVARELLGKYLVRQYGSKVTALPITEVEVYSGYDDKASHARHGKTKRNSIMFDRAGYWYVYFNYGKHWLLNIVIGPRNQPAAILIRGAGNIDGPAKLTKHLHINKSLNNKPASRLSGLWLESRGVNPNPREIKITPRIGVGYAGPVWSKKPWRYVWQRPYEFIGGRLFVATAHPDDESYAAGSLLKMNSLGGGDTMIACATLGEKGTSHLVKPLTVHQIKVLRKKELIKAAKVLKINKLHTFNIPDGKVKNHKTFLYNKYLALAKAYQPDAIISFDETGITGHWDHIAIGQVAKRLARKLKVPMYAFCISPKLKKQVAKWLMTRRRAPHYVAKIKISKPDFKILIDPRTKKLALQAHASQMDGPQVYSGYPAYAVTELLKAEYFRKLL